PEAPQAPLLTGRLCRQPAAQGRHVDVVDERPLAVHFDDRKPFAVAPLELLVAGDVDLVEFESELVAKGRHLRARALAQVAPGRMKQPDASDRSGGWRALWRLQSCAARRPQSRR